MRWPWQRASSASNAEPAGDIAKVGTGGFTPSAGVPGPTKPAGADGVASYGGFIVHGERDRRLSGDQKWITYDNAILNVAIIGAAINVWTHLGGSAKWTVQPNKRGGKDAQRAADIVTEGLIEAQLSKPWRSVVRKQLVKKFRGFAMHEMLIRRRDDGMVVCADLQDRPQWTIWRWNKPDEQSEWIGVEQRTHTGSTPYIPRERLFYSVEDTLSSSPDGVGLLRQLAESVRVLEIYQQLEGIGYQTDLRGMPSARAPLSKLAEEAEAKGAKTPTEIQAFVRGQTQFLVDFLLGHNKKPEQGILVDSSPYTTRDAVQSPSSVPQWAFELVRGGASGMAEIGGAIGRLNRDIARMMSSEWMLLGDVGSGSDAMHADKTAMFGLVVNSALEDVGDDATRDCATRLTGLNGFDTDTCTPRLVPEPVATASVEAACRSLMLLFQAGLNPKDKATDILRGRLNLPPAPEIDTTDWLLPRGAELEMLAASGKPAAGSANGTPTAGQPGQPGNANAQPGAKGGKP